MPDVLQLLLAAMGGGAFTAIGQVCVQKIRSRGETHAADRTVDAKLQEHWTDTTLELVDTLRQELHDSKDELASLRPLVAKLAHFEEALDHIHALLAARRSEKEAEIEASARRAQAFLHRMRGDDKKGEQREAVQRELSAKRVVKDIDQAPDNSKPKG